ncbi:CYtochrome P450 family [Aphelenchoides besseyi]|nr:CYtochrome P450 family [Aphelenchoides besseyi]
MFLCSFLPMWLWFLFLILLALGLLFLYQCWYVRRFYPNGPMPIPLGNALSLVGVDRIEEKLFEWKETYGPIYTFWAGNVPTVTVNDFQLMQEMFVKDGDNYTEKLVLESFDKLTRGGTYGIIGTNGDLWREQRRFALTTLRDFGMNKTLMQERTLCANVNSDLDAGVVEHDFRRHTDICVGSVINNLVCGYRFTENNREEDFYKLKDCLNNMNKAFGSFFASLPITIPILRKFPVFKQRFEHAISHFHCIQEFLKDNIEEHERQNDYETMDEPNDFIDAFLIERAKREREGEPHTFTITWAIGYLICHSDAQKRLHEELDRVVGSDRMVTIADKQKLPYAQACVLESQRRANIIPLNTLRVNSKPVDVCGMTLPKGTTVIPQMSTLFVDPMVFPQPLEFNPARFIDEDGQLKHCNEMIPFSLGRRSCIGESLARMELYLIITNLFNQYEFCFPGVNSDANVQFGRPFSCTNELHSVLVRNQLLEKNIRETPKHYETLDAETWIPVFVTSVSADHFAEIRTLMRQLRKFYPKNRVVVFDLGLNEENDALKMHSAFFYFDTSVLVQNSDLNDLLRAVQRGVLMPFSTETFTYHSVFAATNPKMYEFLPVPPVAAQIEMVQSTAMLVVDSPYTRRVMKWFDQSFWNLYAIAELYGPKRMAVRLNYTTDFNRIDLNLAKTIERNRNRALNPMFKRLIKIKRANPYNQSLGLSCDKATVCISAAGMVINCGILVNVLGYQSIVPKANPLTFIWLSIIALNAVVSFVLLVGVERKKTCYYHPFLALSIMRIGLFILASLFILFGYSTLIIDPDLYHDDFEAFAFFILTIWIEYYVYVVVKRSLNLTLEHELTLIN